MQKPTETPAARLKALIGSGSFNWDRDEKTLRDCLYELEKLELVRDMHRKNMRTIDKLIDGPGRVAA